MQLPFVFAQVVAERGVRPGQSYLLHDLIGGASRERVNQIMTSYKQRNPVGSYLTSFEIALASEGQRVLLHFGGVSSAMYVWVNGREAGYSENSRSPAEFDVTDAVRRAAMVEAVRAGASYARTCIISRPAITAR